MSHRSWPALIEGIHAYCREQRWYGADVLNPSQPYGVAQANGDVMREQRLAHPQSTNFEFPPATEAQLAKTEAELGFPLPSSLRNLYAEVANGGFGPGYGITGAIGGAPHHSGWCKNIADGYTARPDNVRWVDITSIAASQKRGQWFELRYNDEDEANSWYEMPEYLLGFCYRGCNTQHAIHARTGQIYVAESGFSFMLWAPSLEDWLEQWLNGSLRQQ